jgi:hypothetical protein
MNVEILFFFLVGTGVSTQGLVLALQVLYHLSHASPDPSPFLLYFLDKVSCFLLGLVLDCDSMNEEIL